MCLTMSYSPYAKVFESNASQSAIYRHAGAPLAKELIKGLNCAIIVYGQNGSGKTYTMMGDESLEDKSKVGMNQAGLHNSPLHLDQAEKDGIRRAKEEGIIQRITQDIFDEIKNSSASIEFTVRVSYIEIYREQIRDLFNP